MDDFKDQVKVAFQKCRSDIEDLNRSNSKVEKEFNNLKEENLELKQLIKDLNAQVSELKGELKGFSVALDLIKSMGVQNLASQSVQTNSNSESLVQQSIPVEISVPAPVKKSKPVEYKDPYEALLAFKAKANKRDILKQRMVQVLEENMGITLSELKFLFVDHYRYCSKASFYNYLKEAELEKIIKVDRVDGKNKVYLLRPEIISSSEMNYNRN